MADTVDDTSYGGSNLAPVDLSGGGVSSSDYSVSDFLGPAAAVGGLGFLLGSGPPQLPQQFQQAEGMVPGLQNKAQTLYGEGQGLLTQGQQALQMGQAGQLTIPQQAELKQYQTGLQNQTNQLFSSMGRNVTTDTSAINAQAAIDAQVNAMAQKEIQTTIQLGFGEISAAGSFTQESLGYSQAAANILLQAGQAQLKEDQSYSQELQTAFSSVAKMFAAAAA